MPPPKRRAARCETARRHSRSARFKPRPWKIYVLDPIFDEPLGDDDQQSFTVDDPAVAWRVLTDALNSTDADGDGQLRDALAAIRRRLNVGKE